MCYWSRLREQVTIVDQQNELRTNQKLPVTVYPQLIDQMENWLHSLRTSGKERCIGDQQAETWRYASTVSMMASIASSEENVTYLRRMALWQYESCPNESDFEWSQCLSLSSIFYNCKFGQCSKFTVHYSRYYLKHEFSWYGNLKGHVGFNLWLRTFRVLLFKPMGPLVSSWNSCTALNIDDYLDFPERLNIDLLGLSPPSCRG